MPRKLKSPSPSTLRKEAARAALKEALAEEKRRKATRAIAARELREDCKRRRVDLVKQRKLGNAELRELKKAALAHLRARWDDEIDSYRVGINQQRVRLRERCNPDKAPIRAELKRLRAAVERARAEKAAAIAAARKPSRGVRAMNVAERRAHELAQAQQEFHEPWERELLADLFYRRKIKATPRRSLAETFNEWISENSGDVLDFADRYYARQAADYDKQQLAAYELREMPRGLHYNDADFGDWGG